MTRESGAAEGRIMGAMMTTADGLTLQDLILMLKSDRTYLQLEAASGGVVKAQRWNQITNGIRVREFPEPRTIEAMAEALDVSVEVVILAVARSVGLMTSTKASTLVALMPPGVDNLDDDQVSAALGVIRSMVRSAPKKTTGAVGSKKKPVARKKPGH
jgi:hypothetical protein